MVFFRHMNVLIHLPWWVPWERSNWLLSSSVDHLPVEISLMRWVFQGACGGIWNGGKYGNPRKKSLLAEASISPKSRVSTRHPHNQNQQPAGVEQELAMSLCNFSTKALLFSFTPHCSMSQVSWIWMKIGRYAVLWRWLHFILKHIICQDHAAIFRVGSSSSCTAEVNAHHTPEQEVKQKETEVTTLAN